MTSKSSFTSSGITTNTTTGERHVPSSIRPDGSVRREIRIRPGYLPPEDVERYKNRAAQSWKNRGQAGVPGAEGLTGGEDTSKSPPASTTAPSTKNAKKREAKKKAKAAGNEESADASKTDRAGEGGALNKDNWRRGATAEEEEPVMVDEEAEKEKKARNLKKKLKQARELRDKKDQGQNLLPEQFEKVIRINELIRQLDALGFDAEGERKVKDPATEPQTQKDAV